ncbi:MAG: hypothetical protein OXU79_11860 [Gemmatimonadota bacterium]|nr:hypothetical protein [Gemmatimonadota bacterium]
MTGSCTGRSNNRCASSSRLISTGGSIAGRGIIPSLRMTFQMAIYALIHLVYAS